MNSPKNTSDDEHSVDLADQSITALLRQSQKHDDKETFAAVLNQFYDELKQIATQLIRGERVDHTLGATGLLHESLIKLGRPEGLQGVQSKQELCAVATQVMKNILVDYSRFRNAKKRGGGSLHRQPLDSVLDRVTTSGQVDMTDLRQALAELSQYRPRAHQVVSSRMFAELTIADVAKLLEVSTTTVEKEWRFAKAWLRDRLHTEAS